MGRLVDGGGGAVAFRMVLWVFLLGAWVVSAALVGESLTGGFLVVASLGALVAKRLLVRLVLRTPKLPKVLEFVLESFWKRPLSLDSRGEGSGSGSGIGEP